MATAEHLKVGDLRGAVRTELSQSPTKLFHLWTPAKAS